MSDACEGRCTGRNPYLPLGMTVLRIADETDDRTIKSLDLSFQRPEDGATFRHQAGQFCELSLLGVGEAPFGIASAPSEVGWVRFTIKRAGVVTTRLHRLQPSDALGLRGPLGNAFPLDAMRGRDVVLIGGGFAFTTLRALVVQLLAERAAYGRITVIYGARTPDLLMYKDDFAAWQTRDDLRVVQTIDAPAPGWAGQVGFVPNVVEASAPAAENALVVLCGPPVMIRFTLPVLTKLGFAPESIYTSLENRMKCGIGQCGRCNVGRKYVCVDGPVFSLAELQELPGEY